jgi:hypothetical protein
MHIEILHLSSMDIVPETEEKEADTYLVLQLRDVGALSGKESMKIPWSEVEKANLVWKGFEPSCQKGPCA